MPFYQPQKNTFQESGLTPRGGFLAPSTKQDLSSIDGLLKLAKEKGVVGADEIADQDKLSFLERLSSGLGAFNPAEAIARNYEGTESFLTAYPKTVIQGITSAFTGNDYGENTKRRYFGELLDDMGVENKYARFGLGLVGDIFLDPSTYVGGAIVRGGVKGVSFAGRTGLKGIGKVAPKVEEGLIMAGSGAKQAFGDLFVFGYGASKVTRGTQAVDDPSLAAVRKFKSVEEFVEAQPKFFHGTAADFETFDIGKLGSVTGARSARKGIFLTKQRDVAEGFAGNALGKELTGRGISDDAMEGFLEARIVQPQNAKDRKIVQELVNRDLLEDVGEGIFQQKTTGAGVREFAVTGNLKTVDLEGAKRVHGDFSRIIDEAQAEGFDGVTIKNTRDFPFATSPDILDEVTVVFNPQNVKTKSQLIKIFNEAKQVGTPEARSLPESFMEFEGKKVNVRKALAIANAKRFGNDVLTDEQWDEFLGYMFRGKAAEFNFFDEVTDDLINAFNNKFPNAKFPVKTLTGMKEELTEKLGREVTDIEARAAIRSQIVNRLESTATKIPEKIGKLQAIRDKLAQPFIADDLFGLKQTVSELRKELAELTPRAVKKVPKGKEFMATAEEIDSALMNSLSSQKDIYKKMILDLEARIAGIESGLIEPATREVTKQVASKSAQFSTKEIIQQAMRELDPKLKIKDNIVEINQQITRLTNDMWTKQHFLEGVLSGKQIAKERIARAVTSGDFSTLPEELVSALRPVIDDPKVAKALSERIARNAKVAAEAGIEDPFTMYAPSIAKDVTERQRLLNFFSGTKSVKVGSEAYKKEFRNLLKDSDLIKDRALFLRVEDEIATNKLTREFLDQTISDYGEQIGKFATEKEAHAAGYRMLKEKGLFGKEVGWVTEADWKFLNSQFSNNYKALDAIAKATGFDAGTSLFKRFVTGLFAPFHVRNYASGEIQNFEIIGKIAQSPKVQATGLRLSTKISRGAFIDLADPFDKAIALGRKVETFGEEVVELAGKRWRLDDIGKAIEQRFGGSSRYNVDFNTILDDADVLTDSFAFSKEALKEWGKSFTSFSLKKNPIEGLIGQDAIHFKAARVIGAWVEMQQKSKLVIAGLSKGMSMDDALRLAEKGGFEYRALTQFESKVMRRIIPFYSFNRKNAELQLKVLGENPQRINQVIRSVENVQNLWETNLTAEEKDNLPAYLKEYLSVGVGRTREGVPQFVRSFGTPIEAFTELIKFQAEGKSTIERTFLGTLSKVNPYLKVPIEIGIQKDSFRQRDLKEVYTAKEFEVLDGTAIGDWLRLNKIVKKDFATKMPRTTYVADPERLLVARSLFTSRGFTYFNNIFNGDITGFFKVMDLVSGIRTVEVDIERQAGFNERRKIDELGDLLRRNGVLSEFNKLFIPKEK